MGPAPTPIFTLHPPDVIHLMNALWPSLCFATLSLPCIAVNTIWRMKVGVGLRTRLSCPYRYQLTNVESLVLDIVCWRCNIMQSVLVVHVGLNQAHPSPISEARRPCLSWHILFYIVGNHYIPIIESIDSICRDSMGEIYDIWMALNALNSIVCIITCYLVQVYYNLYWYECSAATLSRLIPDSSPPTSPTPPTSPSLGKEKGMRFWRINVS